MVFLSEPSLVVYHLQNFPRWFSSQNLLRWFIAFRIFLGGFTLRTFLSCGSRPSGQTDDGDCASRCVIFILPSDYTTVCLWVCQSGLMGISARSNCNCIALNLCLFWFARPCFVVVDIPRDRLTGMPKKFVNLRSSSFLPEAECEAHKRC